jgi:hypothetical protein
MNKTNVAPLIDELGDTRARIAALERREKELRDEVTALGTGEHRGTKWVARVKLQKRSHVDAKALRVGFPDAAEACTVTATSPVVSIKAEIVEDL